MKFIDLFPQGHIQIKSSTKTHKLHFPALCVQNVNIYFTKTLVESTEKKNIEKSLSANSLHPDQSKLKHAIL